MSRWRTIRLVTAREIRTRGATRGYLIGTVLTALLVLAAVTLPAVLGGDGSSTRELGVVGEAPDELATRLEGSLPPDTTVTVEPFDDREQATSALESEELDAVLVDERELLADGMPDDTLRAALDALLQLDAVTEELVEAGIDADEAVAAVTGPPPLEPVDVSDASGDGSGFLLAMAVTVLLFLGIQLNGASVLSGALEEKSSRVVEVLISAARPWQLLAGKLLGMSVLALAQIGFIVGTALAANAAVDAFDLPTATGALLVVGFLMLVVGFLFYASLYAVAGSLASSLEDAQSSAGPLGFLLTGAYFSVFLVVLPDPSSLWSQILTYFPPTAPFVAPARLGLGQLPTWQASLSVLVTALAAVVTVRLAGRLYASSLLAGGKLTWRDAWRGEPIR